MLKKGTDLMRVYVDTSVLVAAHTREPHTDIAQMWLTSQGSGNIILSTWALVECDSALAIKVRRGQMDIVGQAAAVADITAFTNCFAPFVIPTETDYQCACELCRNATSGLRAGDSLHLALALRVGATHFATLDRVLATNAIAHGLQPLISG
jgi:predicted nucleic acid-binding protein